MEVSNFFTPDLQATLTLTFKT